MFKLLKNNTFINTVMLYFMTFAKMIFPLLTLPYLTRVLSVDSYAIVTYVKSYMVYLQVLIDFGFMLSATREIVNCDGDKNKIGIIAGNTIVAKLILAAVGLLFIMITTLFIPILRENLFYALLSYGAIVLTIFLPDFLFRGIEKMHIITIRFIIMKGIATLLTFVFVKNDAHVLLLPVLDIIGTLVSIVWTWLEIKKLDIPVKIGQLKQIIASMKSSFIIFLSDASTTAFGALNTVLIGIFCSKQDVAFWGVAMQLISAAQSLYGPITGGIFPHMVKKKDLNLIKKLLMVFMPLILLATTFCVVCAKYIIIIISGAKYIEAAFIFRCLTPLLVLSFPSMLFGWPVLGAIDKNKETTFSTVTSAVVQVLCLVVFAMMNQFTLVNVALSRIISEFCLLSIRVFFTLKNKKLFTLE